MATGTAGRPDEAPVIGVPDAPYNRGPDASSPTSGAGCGIGLVGTSNRPDSPESWWEPAASRAGRRRARVTTTDEELGARTTRRPILHRLPARCRAVLVSCAIAMIYGPGFVFVWCGAPLWWICWIAAMTITAYVNGRENYVWSTGQSYVSHARRQATDACPIQIQDHEAPD